jgi:SagB-type dehydrogenase family enzyme
MKLRSFLLLLSTLLTINSVMAQELIKLPEPDKTGGIPLMQALNERSSSRDFIDKSITEQQLSDLLWAAYGINRPELGKHTAPTSRNIQDMQIYAMTQKGAYLYKPEEHALMQILDQDVRSTAGKQDFVAIASVNLIYVSDFAKASDRTNEVNTITAASHCGFIGQNVYLYCASEGLISVFRAMIDKEEIAKTLKLKDNQHVIYCQSVGYNK